MRRSKRSLEGEILIDHRASPGLPPEVAEWADLPPEAVQGGHVFESPIITCGHCQDTVVLRPDRTRERGWCPHCDHYICDACTAHLHLTLRCRPIQQQLDEVYEAIERGNGTLLLLK